jgi:MFS family permease
MSAYIFVAVAGGSIGLLAGGILTQAASWHWIFFINVPVGVIAFLLGSWLIDESAGAARQRIDVLGSVLVTTSMLSLIYAIVKASTDGWGSTITLGFAGLAVALLVAFVALESRLANPIIPLRIFRVRTLILSSVVRGFVVVGMFATFFLGALYFEHVRHFGTLTTGLAFLPMTLVVAIFASGLTARLVARFEAKHVLVAGLTAMLIGLLVLTRLGATSSYFPLGLIAFAVMGIGGGTAFTPLLTIAMSDVPPADAGLGSGIINVSMQGAAALGVAILGTIAADRTKALQATHSHAVALTDGYQLAFLIASACVLVGLLLALFVLPSPTQAPQPAVEPDAELVHA